ncbi:pilus assembly FimT family protein [Geomonas agri]|uniref:pilus assembly FimT family protein n=1 Tax=Geomonas agri TaxID=2873702 RepID=UPI001CD4CE3D|nr:prepilin-type N-terminal cleavage/methylation domain-containing protein [Geomonas agri]
MGTRGLSLVEMMVVIAITATLASIGAISFQKYQKSYRIDAQTRLLFAEMLKARTQAIYQHRGTRVKFYPNRFEVYSSVQEGPQVSPVATHLFSFPVTWNFSGFDNPNGITFDEIGIASNYGSICVDSAAGYGGVDSVVVHYVRISIGKKDKGNECSSSSGSITLK